MTLSEFVEDFPGIINNETNGNKQYTKQQNLSGISGQWTYSFSNGHLDWFLYDSYCDEISRENFEKYLELTKRIIDDFKTIYGEPDAFEFDNKNYKDPYTQRHWGYDVMTAVWRTENTDFRVLFTFKGGKGEYHFLFNSTLTD